MTSYFKKITKLKQKKYQKEFKSFLVEGTTIILELLKYNYPLEVLFCTELFARKYFKKKLNFDVFIIKKEKLSQLGTLKNNQGALAICPIFPTDTKKISIQKNILILDNIQNPNNLGSIMRISDWYGIDVIICSKHSVDLYNTKVIASSMGAFMRIDVYYLDLISFLHENQNNYNIIGTFPNTNTIDTTNIHTYRFEKKNIIILGNETHGISIELIPFIKTKLSIPRYGKAESLNVAIATAIICDNLLSKK